MKWVKKCDLEDLKKKIGMLINQHSTQEIEYTVSMYHNIDKDELLKSDIVIFGANNNFVEEFVLKTKDYLKIKAIIDDFHCGKLLHNIPIESSKNLGKYKNSIAINLTFSNEAVDFFSKLSQKFEMNIIDYFVATHLIGFKK